MMHLITGMSEKYLYSTSQFTELFNAQYVIYFSQNHIW